MFQYFSTAQAFNQYLKTLQPPHWLKRIVVHHTYTPTIAQWKGLKTMQSMQRHYKSLGWEAYPHLFIAPDGIWGMNSLLKPGIHANAANADSYGFEIVGRYDTVMWQEPIKTLAISAITDVVQWAHISLDHIVPHRQFNTAKSCPGRAITMDWVRDLIRAELQNRMKAFTVIVDVANVREDSNTNATILYKLRKNDTFVSTGYRVDSNGHKDQTGATYQWIRISHIITPSGKYIPRFGYIRGDLVSQNRIVGDHVPDSSI